MQIPKVSQYDRNLKSFPVSAFIFFLLTKIKNGGVIQNLNAPVLILAEKKHGFASTSVNFSRRPAFNEVLAHPRLTQKRTLIWRGLSLWRVDLRRGVG